MFSVDSNLIHNHFLYERPGYYHSASLSHVRVRSLNWIPFMLQWFISFPEFDEFSESSAHLGKTPIQYLEVRECKNSQIEQSPDIIALKRKIVRNNATWITEISIWVLITETLLTPQCTKSRDTCLSIESPSESEGKDSWVEVAWWYSPMVFNALVNSNLPCYNNTTLIQCWKICEIWHFGEAV